MSKRKIFENIKQILIIQLGDIGDVIWTIPTLKAVKTACPEICVSLLLQEHFGDLLSEQPFLHKIFEVTHYNGNIFNKVIRQIQFINGLREEKFDIVIDLRSGDRGAIMAYLTGARTRISQYYSGVPFWRNKIFTHLLYPPMVKVRGAADQTLRIVRELGIDSTDTIPRLWISEKRKLRAREILRHEGISDSLPFISVNPFSRWSYKEWGYGKWMEIINWLWDNYKIATVVVGTGDERTIAAELLKNCGGSIINLAGKTTLGELAGVLYLSSLHIGVDSAAPHIAAAVGTPTITICGPSDWYDWAPVGDMHRVVLPDLECVSCQKKGCEDKGWSRCLDELAVDGVEKIIQETITEIFKLKNV
jgi:heptosyltransferase-3